MTDQTKNPKCPRCGTPIPGGAPDQPCPACLMSGAIAGPDDETVSMTTGRNATLREPAQFPSELGGYRLVGLLGRGGMGTVYEAEQLATGRRVALKMLGQQLDSPEMRGRFLREGRLAARGQPSEQPLHLRVGGDRLRAGDHDGDRR